ncbi:hypothetical protein NIES2101_24040 [Calothrix sp. HK-06]|nr:hypothetical protein NIES2101_23905 [Calothrix sp. HK-06]OKH47338.1 hypothetical protein NIES2101_24040 [Calothrix sp. HK-06]
MTSNWIPNNQNNPNPIPSFYNQGLPLYWRNEQSGQIETAIFRFLNFQNNEVSTPPTDYQIFLIRCYFEHYINALCWQVDNGEILYELREDIKSIKSVESINGWINKALSIGLDPL